MPAPPSLPEALFRHAASHPEEPWLFEAEGWDWRWRSWSEVAQEVSEKAESLSGIAAGSRYTFLYTARPEAVTLDLAIQAAGLVAAPAAGPPPPSPPVPLSLTGEGRPITAGIAEKDAAYRQYELIGVPPRPSGRGGQGVRGAGGALIVREGEPVELSAAELIAMAERIQNQIEPTGGRDIIVLSGSLEILEERAMLSWATLAGAAVVLEPNPALRVATAAWVRPTVFHGTAAELAALRKAVEKERKGWLRRAPRLPFRRLRTILVMGSEALPEEEAFWSERGVRVGRI